MAGEEPGVRQGRSLLDALVLLCEEATIGATTDPLLADDAIGSRRSETVLHVTLDDLTEAATRGMAAPAEAPQPPVNAPAEALQAPLGASAEVSLTVSGASAEASPASGVRIGPRLEMGPALHPATARRLCCDTGLVVSLHAPAPTRRARSAIPHARLGGALNLGRRRRLASRAQLRALWDRDQGCRFPGCERRLYLHAHHIHHWADGGPTNLDNLVLLCGQHHRLLHEGEYTLTLTGDTVTIYDHTGRALPAVPAPATPGPATPALPRVGMHNNALPLDPLNGGPLDLDHAVGVVAERWALRATEPRQPHPLTSGRDHEPASPTMSGPASA